MPQGWTAFDYPTRGDKVRATPSFRWKHTHGVFSTAPSTGGKSTSQAITLISDAFLKLTIRVGVDWDQKTRTKAIYRIVEPGHKGWSRHVDTELGNYDFLLGVDVSYAGQSDKNPIEEHLDRPQPH